MGFYTSWALSTLCHHLVVFKSFKESGVKTSFLKSDYRLLGDDIILFHDTLATNYKGWHPVVGSLSCAYAFYKMFRKGSSKERNRFNQIIENTVLTYRRIRKFIDDTTLVNVIRENLLRKHKKYLKIESYSSCNWRISSNELVQDALVDMFYIAQNKVCRCT